jgi:hypothetical protein
VNTAPELLNSAPVVFSKIDEKNKKKLFFAKSFIFHYL